MEIFLSMPVIFIIFLMLGMLLYKLGESIAPPMTDVGRKLQSYACGESERFPDMKKIESNFHIFDIAVFFTILHLTVMMIFTISQASNFSVIGVYFFIIVLIVLALFDR